MTLLLEQDFPVIPVVPGIPSEPLNVLLLILPILVILLGAGILIFILGSMRQIFTESLSGENLVYLTVFIVGIILVLIFLNVMFMKI